MVFANPVPESYASGEYYDDTADYYLSPAKLESDYAPVRFRRELRLFRQYCQHGRVLDVGCSSGAFLFQLHSQFADTYEVLGTDASGPPLDYAESRGVPVLRADFLEHDFQDQRFDAITFWAVLEHLFAPAQFLDKAAALLKPGGLCFVLVPNLGSLAVRLLKTKYRYIYPQHLNYFTKTTLHRLVAKRFEILTTRFTHFNPVVIWRDWRNRGGEVSNEQRAALLARTTRLKQNPLLLPARAIYGLTETALGALGLADNLAVVLRRRT
jgi:2-polyprenyl-3-methyl-5-hydroxy-6-metoxy-1,4-benzoquinol methylase